MKYIIFLTIALLLALPVMAQNASVTFSWDKSADDTRLGTETNPVKYKLWKCTDVALTQCGTALDVGILLEGQLQLAAGSSSYIYVTAYRLAIDGQPTAGIVESGKSNVLNVRVFAPPGNPGNIRIKVVSAQGKVREYDATDKVKIDFAD